MIDRGVPGVLALLLRGEADVVGLAAGGRAGTSEDMQPMCDLTGGPAAGTAPDNAGAFGEFDRRRSGANN
jgi:hypothetical protein